MPRKSKKIIALTEQATSYLTEWADFLGLSQSWEIRIEICQIGEKTTGGYSSAAKIEVQEPYRRALIQVDAEALLHTQADKYEVERSMLHELLHIPLMGLQAFVYPHLSADNMVTAQEHLEDACDFYTHILLRMKYKDMPSVRELI